MSRKNNRNSDGQQNNRAASLTPKTEDKDKSTDALEGTEGTDSTALDASAGSEDTGSNQGTDSDAEGVSDQGDVDVGRGFIPTADEDDVETALDVLDEQVPVENQPLIKSTRSSLSPLVAQRVNAVATVAAQLDTPYSLDYSIASNTRLYRSLFKETLRCLELERVSDMSSALNQVLELMDKYDRTFSERRFYAPIQNIELSKNDLNLYQTLFSVLTGLKSGSKYRSAPLRESLSGLMNSDISERFISWVMVRQS